ncbi:hypothetical protein AGABI1DRAFT_133288 [Agaricus bisporus var. burnettii JB137-S8]|uniref:Uncharacterized protein n=1 Tax=Agaricus bisporus var. burnettii (strain JB137-S8 / ATCC MYA-4627 / FGSC 10392) TaxID=597362 RepID=K5WGL4_AGABU|nr:uncharacterized protein AGABI1DRAFT_133288 [Agaricus bisporus var. burnettii JB137-S8]EKM74416.1 hypothetical protein AGABI1DRAFT_133288 [Agaricus bisporus var. burnettii JB137-S8]
MSIAECPRCGYYLATELKEGLPALEAEVNRLDVLMSCLQEEKAILLRRINNAQEKTMCLPFEVLSNIFLFARPPIQFAAYEPIFYDENDPDHPPLTGYYNPAEYFHLTLAAVSHRWRQVVLSTPQLWTTISLRFLSVFTNFNTSLLDLYFKNAHSLPLSIRLDFSNCALAWPADSGFKRYYFLKALGPLEETIFDRKADRIYSLALIKPPVEWFYFDPENLSHCASMTIYWPSVMDDDDDDDSLLDARDLPCLEHLKLVDSDVLFQLPTTVTTLQLSEIDMTHYIELLEELPKLVKLEITEATTGTFEPVVLHRLEHLTWRKICVDDNHGFLRSLRLVHLTTLEWGEHMNYRWPLSEEGRRLRLAFFSSLPSTLSSLTFAGDLEIDPPGLVDLLCCVPKLAELHFIGSYWQVVVGAVESIGRPPANRGASSSPLNVLPNLCTCYEFTNL